MADASRQQAEKDVFAFCEPVSATTRSREHIRLVGPEGFKYGGGIPNKALCGWNVERGWDLKATVHPARFLPSAETNPTCQACIDAYWQHVNPPAQSGGSDA